MKKNRIIVKTDKIIEDKREKVKKVDRNIIILFFLLLIFLTGCLGNEENISLLEEIRNLKGYIRVISKEEYEFYTYLAGRDLPSDMEESVKEEKILQYANEVNAVYYLGNYLGLCEPYSFSVLQKKMEEENLNRRKRLEKNEPVYGLKQFELTSYFQYTLDNLEIEIINYLTQQEDNELKKNAEKYYDDNQEAMIYRARVTYQVEAEGKVREETATREELLRRVKVEGPYAEFLLSAEVGEKYKKTDDGITSVITIVKIEEETSQYKQAPELYLKHYILDQIYPELIQQISKNNPVELE